jgi:hypothetical protein
VPAAQFTFEMLVSIEFSICTAVRKCLSFSWRSAFIDAGASALPVDVPLKKKWTITVTYIN